MSNQPCIAFAGSKQIASGDLREVALKAKAVHDRGKWTQVLIFDAVSSQPIDVDFSGTAADVSRRVGALPTFELTEPAAGEPRRPGRPKLGVVAREVTLLPRHWDWLATQPGGASVALRKLVEHARAANQGADRKRQAQEAAYRFMSAVAGNAPGFEESIRALFAGNQKQFDKLVKVWPPDVRDHAKNLAAIAFQK